MNLRPSGYEPDEIPDFSTLLSDRNCIVVVGRLQVDPIRKLNRERFVHWKAVTFPVGELGLL